MFLRLLVIISLLLQHHFSSACTIEAQTKSPVMQVSEEEVGKILKEFKDEKVVRQKINGHEDYRVSEAVSTAIRQEESRRSTNLSFSSSGDSADAALIIFAVVGLVVIIMWLPYFPVMLSKALSPDNEDVCLIHSMSLEYSDVISSSARLNSYDSGSLLSARYSTYIKEIEEDDVVFNGLSFEFGRYSFEREAIGNNPYGSDRGGYFMLGPSMLIGRSYTKGHPGQGFSKLDLMAGTSLNSDLGLMAKAEFSVHVNVSAKTTVGLGLGGLYIDANKERGLASETSFLDLFYGLKIGHFF